MAELSLDSFEAEARAFLDEHAPRKEAEQAFVWGEGSDALTMFEEMTKQRDRHYEGLGMVCQCPAHAAQAKANSGFRAIDGEVTDEAIHEWLEA